MKQPSEKDIAQMLRDNITFSGQVGDYVIHGAIEKIKEYIVTAYDDGFDSGYQQATSEAIKEINKNYTPGR